MKCEYCEEHYDDRDNSMGYGDTKCPHCGKTNWAETEEERNGMITNDTAPFETGDIISYAGAKYEVIKNYGSSGTVKALDDGGVIVNTFHWFFDGETAVLVEKAKKVEE
jgi:phage FluMu protein Com